MFKLKFLLKFIVALLFVGLVSYCSYLAGQISNYADLKPVSMLASGKQEKPIFVPTFTKQPKNRCRFVYSYDSVEALGEFRKGEHLDSVVFGCKTDFDIAVKLMHWVRSQWEPGKPSPYPPINAMEILKRIRDGETGGFCAQYCYVFVQAMQSFGYKARYVTIRNHEVSEVFLPSMDRWVCFDPFYDSYYVNEKGFPLSAGKISAAYRISKKISMIGSKKSEIGSNHFARFEYFAVWIKNDHVGNPINFDGIERYKVYLVNSKEDIAEVPLYANYSSFIEDFYEGSWFAD
jgi:hypothetical protein